MIPATSFDHTVTVWAPKPEGELGTLRTVLRKFARVQGAERVRMKVYVTRERREDTGGGDRTTGEYKALCRYGVEVKTGDVLEVLEGPEIGRAHV